MNAIQETVPQPLPVPLEPLADTIEQLRECVVAGEAVEGLEGNAGIKAILDGVASRQRVLQRELQTKSPTWNGAEYADKVGHLKGLAEIEGIAAAVVRRGQDAARKLREREGEGS